MRPLGEHIAALIRANGPLTIAEYMSLCLQHPEHGYYVKRDPLGAAGDFITAPEISQMFGEFIGLCLAQSWLDAGQPSPFTLAELGPGRGTLMADILRATRGVPGFIEAADILLIETSPALRAVQAETLAAWSPRWSDSFEPSQNPLYLVANEFFDALPIRQFQRTGNGWRERVVGLHENRLNFGLTEPAPIAALAHRLADTKDGDIVETSARAEAVAQTIGAQITAHGGVALIIDYGDWRSQGDTFQAITEHEMVDPLAAPGKADLTAHVDFEALATAAEPAHSSLLTPQGVFLERLGITQRAQMLAANLDSDALETHISAHRRLTHPEEMGSLFKVMALFAEGASPPPGLFNDR
ncbi:class I SAM-dependent methyltransferase [Rhodobacteraceae bacterium 63075]|nr:class I SAM-dependent methyltransferase [Rhodobacteraceae bacterium 63075]